MKQSTSFIITDVETDGPDPGRHSMLSLASVVRGADGQDHGEFAVNLQPLPEADHDRATMQWWCERPSEWQQATRDPKSPVVAMHSWAEWVQSRPGTPVFVAHPLAFDGAWVDWYLQRFVGRRLFVRAREPGLCHGAGLDIQSIVMAVTGWEYQRCTRDHYPATWLGGHPHSHCALDDARGYAHLFTFMLGCRMHQRESSR